jgi:hypothetical protein
MHSVLDESHTKKMQASSGALPQPKGDCVALAEFSSAYREQLSQ